MPIPEIAIVDHNTLSCIGLQNLLEEIIPQAVIRSFRSFAELTDDTPDMYVHYFVSAQIFFEHTAFFLQRATKTIVLAGSDNLPQLSGMNTLNIWQDEKGLVRSADRLHISLTTVISHRRNITEKLGIKSVPSLTIYAVMHGYVEADQV